MKNILRSALVFLFVTGSISAATFNNPSITSVPPASNPTGFFYGFQTALQNMGQGINQALFSAGLENPQTYIAQQQLYDLESERELYAISLAVQNGTLSTSSFNSTAASISQNVNGTLKAINASAFSTPSVFTNASVSQNMTNLLVSTNATFNNEAAAIVSTEPVSVAIPAVVDPPPGATYSFPVGTSYYGSGTYYLPQGFSYKLGSPPISQLTKATQPAVAQTPPPQSPGRYVSRAAASAGSGVSSAVSSSATSSIGGSTIGWIKGIFGLR